MNTLFDSIFDLCVLFLSKFAKLLGITYNELNVLVFCIIWPIFTIFLIVRLVLLKKKLGSLNLKYLMLKKNKELYG